MSRLADLLNPAPTTSSDSDQRQNSHARYPSLSSPLESLAIAASDGPARPAGDTSMEGATANGSEAESTPQSLQPRQNQESMDMSTESSFPRDPQSMTAPHPPANTSAATIGEGQPPPPAQDPELKVEASDQAGTHGSDTAPGSSMPATSINPTSEAPNTESRASEKTDLADNTATPVKPKPILGSFENAKPTAPSMSDVQALESPQGVDSLKEEPPRSAGRADKRKGTAGAARKPAAKKRKIEPASKDATPVSQRSATPSSSRASKTPVPKSRKESMTPAPGSTPPRMDGEGDEDDESGDVYCICRKPDDHTWMIGCDGGCEDWFHGRCVNISQRDEDLIDRYICPNCSAKGAGVTTWKPMCRLDSCRNPARATGPNPSKYCSDAHGEQYMRQRVLGKEAGAHKEPPRKKRKEGQSHASSDSEDPDEPPHLRGGYLRPGELKALVSGVDSIDEFKKLGEPITTPKRLPSHSEAEPKAVSTPPSFSPSESAQLQTISQKRDALQKKLDALKAREKFAELIRGRAKGVLDEMKRHDKTLKDICGYDARLSWSDKEFDDWRLSNEGQQVLATGILGPPTKAVAEETAENPQTSGDRDTKMVGMEEGTGVCQKKRCERHKQWYKIQIQEVAFEKEECRQARSKLEKDERGMNERAMRRSLDSIVS